MARRLTAALARSEYRSIESLVAKLNDGREKPLRYETVRKWFADWVSQVHHDIQAGLEDVCSALGVPYAELWQPFDTVVKTELTLSPDVFEVARKLTLLSPIELDQVRQFVVSLQKPIPAPVVASVQRPIPAPDPAAPAVDAAIDTALMARIKDRIRAAGEDGGDPSDAALIDILQGRKPNPEKGIKAIPRLHSPTSRWHTNMVRKAVKSRVESGMPLDQAVDSMLDAFKQTGSFST